MAQSSINEPLFVGRTAEIEQFRGALRRLLQRDGSANGATVYLLSGDGGMGKSALARRLVAIAERERPFAGKFQTLWIDWADEAKKYPGLQIGRDQVNAELVFRVVRAAAGRLSWGKQFAQFNKAIRERAEAERRAVEALVKTRSDDYDEFAPLRAATADAVGRIVRLNSPVPIGRTGERLVEAFAEAGLNVTLDQAGRLRTMLENVLRARLKPELFDLFLNPNETLALALARGLANIAEKHGPLIIVFDSYETIDRTDIWVRELIKAAGPNVLWLLAGRNNLLRSRRFGSEYFKGYEQEFAHHLLPLHLQPFTADEVTTYFAARVPQRPLTAAQITQITQATHGIPLAVHEASDIWASGAELTAIVGELKRDTSATQIVHDLTDSYLRHVVQPQDRQMLYALALARGDVELLRAMLGVARGGAPVDLAELLRRLERDYASVYARHARLHAEPERILLEHLKSDLMRSSDPVRALNAAALNVLEARHATLNQDLPLVELRAADDAWIQNALDIAWHRFWLSPQAGWMWIVPRFVEGWAYSDDLLLGLLEVGAAWQEHLPATDRRLLSALHWVTSDVPADGEKLLLLLDRLAARGWLDGSGADERAAILKLRWGQLWHSRGDDQRALAYFEAAEGYLPAGSRVLRKLLADALEAFSRDLLSAAASDSEASPPPVTASALPTPRAASIAPAVAAVVTESRPAPAAPTAPRVPPTNGHTPDASATNGSVADTVTERLTLLTPERPQGWYHLGVQRARRGAYTAARTAFERAVRLNPFDATAHIGLADMLARHNDQADAALAAYATAAELDPQSAAPHLGRARLLARRGDVAAAEVAYQSALALNPGSAAAQTGLGDLYRNSGQPARAIEAYRRALVLRPAYAPAWCRLGELYEQDNQTPEAIAAWQQAARLDPRLVEPLTALGRVFQQIGCPQDAQHVLARAVELQPDDIDLQVAYGIACADAGADETAGAVLSAAIERDPDRQPALLALARLRLRWDDAPAALALLARARALPAVAQFPYTLLGDTYFTLDQPHDALHAYRLGLADPATATDAQIGLARTYERLGDAGRALIAYRHAVRQRPHSGALQAALGRLYAHFERFEAARQAYEHAIAADGATAPLLSGLGRVYQRLGATRQARQTLERAVQTDPTHAPAHCALADLLYAEGDLAAAQRSYQQAVTCDPGLTAAVEQLAATALARNDLATAGMQYARLIEQQRAAGRPEADPAALLGLAEVYYRRQAYVDARQYYERAQAAGAGNRLPYAQLADVYLRLGEPRAAIAAFNRAGRGERAAEPVTLVGLADAYRDCDDTARATTLYQQALARLHDDTPATQRLRVRAYSGLGDVFTRQNRPNDALAAYELGIHTPLPAEESDRPLRAHVLCGLANAQCQLEQTDNALANYERALQLAPGSVDALAGAGELYAAAGRSDDALAAFSRVARLAPERGTPFARLGDLYLQRGQFTEAAAAYQQAVQRLSSTDTPVDATLWLRLGRALVGRQAQSPLRETLLAARDAFRQAAVANATLADAYIGLGDCYLQLGDATAARAAYERAVELGVPAHFPHSRLAQAYLQTGAHAAAAQAFEQALAHNPDDGPTLRGLAHASYALGRRRAALAAYEQAVQHGAADLTTWLHLADLYRAGQQIDPAFNALQHAVALDRDQIDAWRALAALYRAEGEAASALAAQREVVRLAPTDAAAQLALGELLALTGQEGAALDAYRQAVALDGSLAAAQRNLGRLLLARGEPAAALPAFERAVQQAPEDAEALIGLGSANLRLDRPQAALAAFDSARQYYRGADFPYAELGEAYRRAGRLDDARQVFAHAIEKQPTAAALLGLGQTQLARREYAEARATFERVLHDDANAAAAHAGLGRALAASGQPQAAIAHFQQAVAGDAADSATLLALADLHADLDQWQEALIVYSRAAARTPLAESAPAQAGLGRAHMALGHYAAALPALTQALTLDANDVELYELLATAQQQTGNPQAAIATYRRLLTQEPNYTPALIGLGLLLHNGGDSDAAQPLLEGAIAPLAPRAAPPLLAQAHAALGDIHHRRGHLDRALPRYEQARRIDADAPVAPRKLADAWLAAGNDARAQEAYEQALRLDRRDVEAYIGLGNVQLRRGDAEAALRSYRWAIGLDPQRAAPYLPLGRLYAARGDLREALATFDRAIELEPDNIAAYSARGHVYAELGNYRAAVEAFEHALARNSAPGAPPDDAAERVSVLQTTVGLAEARVQLGDWAGAQAAYMAALTIDAESGAALRGLAQVQLQQGAPADATASFRRAVQRDERDGDAWFGLGRALLTLAQPADAAAAFEQARTHGHDPLATNRDLGQAWLAADNPQRALPAFQQVLAAQPDDVPALIGSGRALYHLNRLPEARAALERALTLAADVAATHTAFAAVCAALGDEATATQQFAQAVALDPHDPAAYIGLGDAHLRAQRLTEALDAYRAALAIDGTQLSALKGAGFACYEAGELPQAIDYLEAAVAQAPEDVQTTYYLGRAHELTGGHRRALVLYRSALQIDSRNPAIHTSIGDAYRLLGYLDEALLSYNVALEKERDYAPAHTGRGFVYILREQPWDARRAFQQALRIDPHQPEPLKGEGDVHLRNGRLSDALVAYERALSVAPDYAAAHVGRGMVLFEQQQYDDAAAAFETALTHNAWLPEAYGALGDVHRARQEFARAAELYERAIALNANDVYSHVALIGIERRRGRPLTALEALIDRARMLMAQESYFNRACFEAIAGNAVDACQLLQRALEGKQADWEMVTAEPDFDFIRGEAPYLALAQRFAARTG